MNVLVERLKADLLTFPSWEIWLLCLGILALYAVIAFEINRRTGLFTFKRSSLPPYKLFSLFIIAIFSPSLLEESLYRGLFIPRVSEAFSQPSYAGLIGLSLFLYVAAHPLIAWLVWPWSRQIFYRPAFLAIVFLLGLACTLVYLISHSLWPAILIHWFTIVVWKLFYGGPDFGFDNSPKALVKTG
ncbi:MAG: CPBP family intramembrane metalloprotease [Trueperaceae bacterium]|nr:CPBP family intramembrane metalloprotease [Trueperaceae bacterium]